MKARFLILWSMSVAAAYLAGHFLSPIMSSTETLTASSLSGNQSSPSKVARSGGDTASSPTQTGVSNTVVNSDDERSSLERILDILSSEVADTRPRLSLDYALIARSYNVISQLNESELVQLLASIEREQVDLKPEVMALLIERYATFNPIEAIEYIERQDLGRHAIGMKMRALENWAHNAPIEAFEWYQHHRDELGMTSRRFSLHPIIKGLAREDVYRAFDTLLNLQGDRFEVRSGVSGLVSEMENGGQFEDLLNMAVAQDAELIEENLLTNWMKKDPQAVTDWLSVSGRTTSQLETRLMSTWMNSSPDNSRQAANWYLSQSSGDDRTQRVDSVMSMFSNASPEEGLNWLKNLGDNEQSRALAKLIRYSAFRHPDFAIAHLERIQNAEEREVAATQIYRGLQYNNPKQAQAFIDESPFKEQILRQSGQN